MTILSARRLGTVQRPTPGAYATRGGTYGVGQFGHSWDGWTLGMQSGWSDPGQTLTPQGFLLPGNNSYAWRDDHRPVQRIQLQMQASVLGDLFFGCDATGAGMMFRIDTRPSSPTGFAATSSWTAWNSPVSGPTAVANRWYDVTVDLGTTEARATVVGPSSHSVITTAYTAQGSAIGLQGDGGGGQTVYRNLTVYV